MSSVNKNIQSRKFQFFDIIKENIESNEENKKTDTKKDKKSDEDNNESNNKLNINISSISQINDMQILDGVIFMNATITEKKKDSNKLLKIVNNIVIDEYIMFNTYYDFIILQNEKPMLIVFGSMRYADNIKHIFLHFLLKRDAILDGWTGIQHEIRLFGDLELILPVREDLYLMVEILVTNLRILADRILRRPGRIGGSERIVDTYRSTETLNKTTVIHHSHFQTVELGDVHERILRISHQRRVQT